MASRRTRPTLETVLRTLKKFGATVKCSKIDYRRETTAERAARSMERKNPGEKFEEYRCGFCDGWHIDHERGIVTFDTLPPDVSAGTILVSGDTED